MSQSAFHVLGNIVPIWVFISCSISFPFHIITVKLCHLHHGLVIKSLAISVAFVFPYCKSNICSSQKIWKLHESIKKKQKSIIIPSSRSNHCFILIIIIPIWVVLREREREGKEKQTGYICVFYYCLFNVYLLFWHKLCHNSITSFWFVEYFCQISVDFFCYCREHYIEQF